jgi:heptosyltransferase-2
MTIQKIIIRCVNWVGDTIIATPTIRAIRERFPEARIVVIARPWVAPLLRNNPDVDEIWEENGRSPEGSTRALIRRMRAERFDLGFALPNSFASALLLRMGGVARRVGYARDGRRLLLTDPVPLRPELLRDHEVKYYLNLLSALGEVPPPPPLVLREDPDAAKRVDALLESEGITAGTPLVGINPGAFYGTAKRWAPDRFAAVARRLAEATGAHVIVTGTDKETPAAMEVCTGIGRTGIVHNLAGRITLQELISLIRRMTIFVTNDSGAMHIAAALRVPTVAVFGSTDWVTTPPWSDEAIVVRRDTPCAPCLLRHCPIDHRCMDRVSVDDVLEATRARWPALREEKSG